MREALAYLHQATGALEDDAPTYPELLTMAAARIAEMQLRYRGELIP